MLCPPPHFVSQLLEEEFTVFTCSLLLGLVTPFTSSLANSNKAHFSCSLILEMGEKLFRKEDHDPFHRFPMSYKEEHK
jgi:hypothetical protein